MIWLEQGEEFLGCVAVLKKNYSEKQIREMSEHSVYEGWSALSILVTKIQGINAEFHGGIDKAPEKLIDINFYFDFECLYNSSSANIQYVEQVAKVFENLTLYVVERRSKKQMNDTTCTILKNIKEFISYRTYIFVKDDIKAFFRLTKETTDSLDKILEMLKKFGFELNHELISDATEEIIRMANEERKIEQTYYMENI